MQQMLKSLADNTVPGSLANKLRKKRFRLFLQLIDGLPRPLKIIDVGGTGSFWQQMDFPSGTDVEITLLNLHQQKTAHKSIKSVAGDACDMQQFGDNTFDVAFSNSVIEHVGTIADQQSMASEMQRIAPVVFLQTPNHHFPLEPHFLFPFFQYLPMKWRVWLLMRFNLGWYRRCNDKEKATAIVRSVRLLTRKELKALFPRATIHKERLAGLTKSFVVAGPAKKQITP